MGITTPLFFYFLLWFDLTKCGRRHSAAPGGAREPQRMCSAPHRGVC
jgi:hypothetical protein